MEEQEYLDIVDANDLVTGKALRDEVYAQMLTHRIVHVMIFNAKGELALQLRSKSKSFCPSHWSTSVGGHVQSGESYEVAALREFEEEIGHSQPIHFVGKYYYNDTTRPQLYKFLSVFETNCEGPFQVNLEEVEKVEYFPLKEVSRMIKEGEKFHPELLYLLKKQYSL